MSPTIPTRQEENIAITYFYIKDNNTYFENENVRVFSGNENITKELILLIENQTLRTGYVGVETAPGYVKDYERFFTYIIR